jgi:histone H1/5
VSKSKGAEISSLLHQLGVEVGRNPYGQHARKLMLEIDPQCKDRLPKRVTRQPEADGAVGKASQPEPAKTLPAATRRKPAAAKEPPPTKERSKEKAKQPPSKRPTAAKKPAPPAKKHTKKGTKKPTTQKLAKRKPR